ncbi:hypothetical protein LOD99_2569 [Oopsacas minuta]|uniref:GPI ethanolamine phosphate transferase 1 n=1 Tax=Oopsacas minuta TaxID=111878 RepID=A0AAV7K0S6_9METZ|nr:hypothetical protein LOD99_2569 [Oopsacas minuta]
MSTGASQVKYGLLFLLVHTILIKSIFDVYFTSPLVIGAPPISVSLSPPAERLVLFIADGLRADLFFSRNETNHLYSPFLHNIIQTQGSWGVSHTRVPTETRPGHVALIAGFYEDVSAVTRGWQDNPVEFDSLFNRSRRTFSWGSAEVLLMFAKGTSIAKVNVSTTVDLDFGLEDSSVLDEWVFNEIEQMFENAQLNSTLAFELRKNKLVFFLHLIGLDANGHSHRPNSPQYLNNIAVVDQGVKRVVRLFEDFYEDNSTAYVYTSDHGMTNWGSHGAGHPHETLTPLVCWGAGIRPPLVPLTELYLHVDRDGVSLEGRIDVNQADITPLMSVLIGLPFPVNSIGKLPLKYLNTSDLFKAEAIKSNALSILRQMELKENAVRESSFSAFYSPFPSLTPSKQVDFVRRISVAINKQQYNKAISLSEELIALSISALKYFHDYNKLFLYILVTSIFILWILYCVLLLLNLTISLVPKSTQLTRINYKVLLLSGLISTLMLYLKSSDISHYLYSLLAALLLSLVYPQLHIVYRIPWSIKLTTILSSFLFLILIWVMVAGFHYRQVFSLGLIILAFWPYLYTDLITCHVTRPVTILWTLVCCVCSVFPILSVDAKTVNYPIVIVAGVSTFLICIWLSTTRYPLNRKLLSLQSLLLLICIVNVAAVYTTLSLGLGTHLISRIASWCVLLISIFIPILSSHDLDNNFFHSWLSLYCPYILLSISHEALFSLLFPILLYIWLLLESIIDSRESSQCTSWVLTHYIANIPSEQNHQLSSRYVRRALFIAFFGLLGFFGTGNIASVNTFDIASVYAFITLYSPFTMGLLLIVKIGIPLLMVGNAFNLLIVTTQSRRSLLFLLVLIICDFMALHFFFMITDEGSWLQIGTSISHYVIAMGMILGITLITALASIYVNVDVQDYLRMKQQ